MPPRPGTPEYDAFTKKQGAKANRDKSKDKPKPEARGSEADAVGLRTSATMSRIEGYP